MTFIQRFLFAWRSASIPDYVLDADLPDFWTNADKLTLAGYFRSDSGRKLKAILSNYVLKSAFDATQGLMENGHARGIASTVTIINQHMLQPEDAPAPDTELSEEQQAFMQEIGA